MRVLEIFIEQIRNILVCMITQDSEKIVRRRALAFVLVQVILQETKEGLVTDAETQGFEELRAAQVDGVNVLAIHLALEGRVERNDHVAMRCVRVDTVIPPPLHERWIGLLVEETLTVRAQR